MTSGQTLRQATTSLTVAAQPKPFPRFTVPDGRYLGSTGRWWLEVRVDSNGSGAISADLQTRGPAPDTPAAGDGARPTLVQVSLRTPRGSRVDPAAGRWTVLWETDDGAIATGWIAVSPVPDVPGRLTVTCHLDAPLGALLTPATITAGVTRAGDALRELGLEVEVQHGVTPPRAVVFEGRPLDVQECLARAGFAVHPVGNGSVIPAPPGGVWSGDDVLDELNQAMRRSAQASLDVPVMEAHLLLLSRSQRPEMLGVMFSHPEIRPRQGAAVFVDSIRDRYPADRAEEAERRIVQSMAHELGHVLNLSHRFAVGYWNSASIMTYPWCYRGGRHDEQFFRDFRFSYDPDELEFLRHGRRSAVTPGGERFGSDPYWLQDAGSAEDDRVPADPRQLRLWLTPPGIPVPPGATVTRGEPLFLGVSLHNVGKHPVVVPRYALDVKAGLLDISVRRIPDGGGAAEPFVPVLRRCYDVTDARLVRLGGGQSLHDNVQLGLGARSLVLPEAGTYEVVPRLRLPSGRVSSPGAVVEVHGPALTVTVTEPMDGAARADAEVLQRTPLALSLAMGGTKGRDEAARQLVEIRDRRRRDRGGAAGGGAAGGGAAGDGVVAVIDRLAGIERGRQADHALAVGERRPELHAQAAELLAQAVRDGTGVFDPHTREHTRRLAARHRARAAQASTAEAPRVVVDLAVRTPDGAEARHRMAGVLRVTGAGQGWGIIAPPGSLPPAAMEDGTVVAEAVATIAGNDGLTERVAVSTVDVLAPADGGPPALLRLWLPRPVAAEPDGRVFRMPRQDAAIPPGGTLWQVLARAGLTPADLDTQVGEAVDPWTEAASTSLGSVPAQLVGDVADLAPRATAVHRPLRIPEFGNVGDWVCSWAWWCDQDGPKLTGRERLPFPFSKDYPWEPDGGDPEQWTSES